MLLFSIWLNLENFAFKCLMALALTLATGPVVVCVALGMVVDCACDACLGVVAREFVVGWVLRNLLIAFYRLYLG